MKQYENNEEIIYIPPESNFKNVFLKISMFFLFFLNNVLAD